MLMGERVLLGEKRRAAIRCLQRSSPALPVRVRGHSVLNRERQRPPSRPPSAVTPRLLSRQQRTPGTTQFQDTSRLHPRRDLQGSTNESPRRRSGRREYSLGSPNDGINIFHRKFCFQSGPYCAAGSPISTWPRQFTVTSISSYTTSTCLSLSSAEMSSVTAGPRSAWYCKVQIFFSSENSKNHYKHTTPS